MVPHPNDSGQQQEKSQPKRSLRGKLTISLILTSIIILLLTFAGFVFYDKTTHRTDYINDIDAISQAVSNNAGIALAEDNHQMAITVLESLKYHPNIRYARLSDNDHNEIATYVNNWDISNLGDNKQPAVIINDAAIEIFKDIVVNDFVIGYLHVVADTDELHMRQFEFIYIGGALLLLAILISAVLSSNIVKSFTKPVYKLANFSRQISRDKDYSKRAPTSEIREIDTLVSSINGMLGAISGAQNALNESKERLSLALKGAGEGLWDLDLNTQKIFLDKHSTAVLAMGDEDVLLSPRQLIEKIHPADRARFKEYSNSFINNNQKHFNIEFRASADVDWVWLRLTGEISRWNDNQVPQRLTGTLLDITKQRETQAQVRLYASVFDNTSDAIAILDAHLNVVAVNMAFTDITQYSALEMKGKPLPVLSQLMSKEHIEEQLKTCGHWQGEVSDHRKDGFQYVLELALNTVKPSDEQDYNYVVAVFSDITQRKKTQDELFFMANYDPLTKLANRAMFQNSFANAINNAQRHEQTLAILFIDLDKFKLVNDTLGHDAGDELLIQAAKRLQSHVRQTDIVSRLSGDEFTIILDNINDVSQVQTIATKIQQDFQRDFKLQDQLTNIGTSIGIAIYPSDGTDVDTLLKNADTAMYYAKTNGRNNFHFFSSSMNELAERRNLVEVELREAIKRKEIEVLYQPKIQADTEAVYGFEALVRWHHPTMGLVSPDEFIPVAEEVGIIRELGQYIFRTATNQLIHWHSMGYTNVHMAVNVSAREFQLSDYPLELAKLINEFDIASHFIELELTESIVMDDPEKMTLMLDVIKNLGFTLSIDDFGTGYSSLSYLQKLPVDVLKVDQSFVRDIEHNPNSSAIAKAIVSMAHSLNLKVVAEGVETEAQLDFFKQNGTELIQGYYFSKPLTKDEARRFLHEHSAPQNH
ncbi:EAL domain-containing protein [Psychrobium sp. MM17-31]|uniref:EAL domain-containing protein n=1 Tax=Psychrobium sp. MM17-31 TaxID=2917758 RepID=UPI001EF46D65|nr:EAL domain-containing protein [Psychrobium sp. MM17-31]MCG7533131.1 EAL domain-containing protein [Psychrobium sp. MM17-31]